MEEKDTQPLLNEGDIQKMQRKDDFLPACIWVPAAIWRVIKGAVLWVVGFVIDIFISLGKAGIAVYNLVVKGAVALYNGVKSLCHKFRYNDWSGRLSYLLFGVSYFRHGRYVNGALMLLFEVGYIVLFALFGAGSIYSLHNLGDNKTGSAGGFNPETGQFESAKTADNSVLIIVYGVLWIMSLFVFLYIWKKSIDTGYANYRIAKFDDFERRAKMAEPYSNIIDRDIGEHELYAHSKKELKERYADVYEAAYGCINTDPEANPGWKMDKAYISYILDNTIRYRKKYHKTLTAKNAKARQIEEKIEALKSDSERTARYEQLQSARQLAYDAYAEAKGKVEQASLILESDTPEARSARIKEAKKGLSGISLKKIMAENKAVGYKQSWDNKVDKLEEKLRVVNTQIDDLRKNNLSFSVLDSVENQTKYGRFNTYYENLASIDREITFYQLYDELVADFEKGFNSYTEINAENAQGREKLTESRNEKMEAINKQYDSIEARRQSIIDEGQKEKENLAKAIAAAKADASLSEAERREAINEAKARCAYNLKTVKGKVLALPTKKEVKAAKKEEVVNVNRAYKRDFRGLKVDYTAEEYGTHCAASTLIVDHGFDFAYAYKMVREHILKKRMEQAEVEGKLSELRGKRSDYVEAVPTKFDGKPKTVLAQLRSMLDENFHTTLLFLPIVGVLLFTVMPLALSIMVAFTNFNVQTTPPTSGFSWVGWNNFVTLLVGGGTSSSLASGLSRTVVWTFVWAICATFSNYFLGIIFALMINKDGVKFKGFWRFMFMLAVAVPQFISLIAMSLLLKNTGALGNLYYDLTGNSLNFATSHVPAEVTRTKIIIILVNIWVGIPYTILQTSGILLNIPRDLYESSKIDGANTVVQFTKITLPYIFFVTGPSLIQTFIGNINNFGVIYFLTGGGFAYDEAVYNRLLGETDLLITYIYKVVTSVNNGNYGLASAIGIIVFVICAFVSIVMYNKTSSASREDQFQ